jgi:hypothetical protein
MNNGRNWNQQENNSEVDRLSFINIPAKSNSIMHIDKVEAALEIIIPILDECSGIPAPGFPNYSTGTLGLICIIRSNETKNKVKE